MVASIKAPIIEALPELQALVGLDATVILAPIAGDVELTVSQIATIVGGDLEVGARYMITMRSTLTCITVDPYCC